MHNDFQGKNLGIHSRFVEKHLQYFMIFTSVEAFISFLLLLGIPRSTENEWLFGYSFNRAVLILGMLVIFGGTLWLTFKLWHDKNWVEKIAGVLGELPIYKRATNVTLTFLVSGFTFLFYVLLVWGVTEDAYYLAYLVRFGPFLLFATLVIVQLFGLILWYLPAVKRMPWVGSLFLGMALVVSQGWYLIWDNKLDNVALLLVMFLGTFYAQWMFRIEYGEPLSSKAGWAISPLLIGVLLLVQLLFIPKKYLIHAQTIFHFIFMILVVMAALTHGISRALTILSKNNATRFLVYLCIAGIFVFAGWQYFRAGIVHAEMVNVTYMPNDDEQAFMDFAIQVRETGFKYSGWRNQMPIYPYIQAFFYKPGATMDEFFPVAKHVNIVLSMMALVFLFFLSQKYLPLYQAVSLSLLVGFGLYVYKSGYVLVETFYYIWAFAAYILLCVLLVQPSLKHAVWAGIVLGVAHLTKASVLPAVLLFAGLFLLKEVVTHFPFRKRHRSWRNAWDDAKPNLFLLAAVFLVFFLVISPYGIESKKLYGGFFYNINNDFLWYDSYGAALQGPTWSEDISPAVKYFQDHSFADIWDRIEYGLHWQAENLQYQYGFFNYLAFQAGFFVFLFLLNIKQGIQLLKLHFFAGLFVVLYFSAYFFLSIWYSPISSLPRFLYAMYIPFVFTIYYVSNKLASNTNLPLIRMVNFAVFVMAGIDVWHIASNGPFFRDFGS